MVSIQTTNQPTRQDWVASTLSEKIFPGMSSKRSLEDLEGNEEWQPKKRKSRFDKSDDTAAAVSAAALKAAQLTASLRAQAPTSAVSSSSSSVIAPNVNDIQAQIQAQIASVTSALQSAKQEKKAAPVNRTLRLDAMGREIDEQGNVIKSSGPVRTLAIHVAEGHALKKKRTRIFPTNHRVL